MTYNAIEAHLVRQRIDQLRFEAGRHKPSDEGMRQDADMLEALSARVELLEEALGKIAGGFVNSDFVLSSPPDWHSAFSQLQAIARVALEKIEE